LSILWIPFELKCFVLVLWLKFESWWEICYLSLSGFYACFRFKVWIFDVYISRLF
jgi:hypothetical protein